ncbi:hypothetical protein ACJROX_15455 [Pseudalkalibacillus sp. A8]|uniref:hypothetical protein n=1 Tax=Pseudalkalibacillus sp. A8 TaxID=3382641 RepID=UPI0038B4A0D9
MNSRVAIVEGKASEVINIKKVQGTQRAIFSLNSGKEEGKPIGMNVLKNDRKMKVKVEGDSLEVRIQSRMEVAVNEYPAGAAKPKSE